MNYNPKIISRLTNPAATVEVGRHKPNYSTTKVSKEAVIVAAWHNCWDGYELFGSVGGSPCHLIVE